MWPWDRSTAEDRARVAELAEHLRPAVDPAPEVVRDCGDARRDWPLNAVASRGSCDNRRPFRYGHPSEFGGGVRPGWTR